MLTCLVPVLFTFYVQNVLKLKKNNSVAKGLMCAFLVRFREARSSEWRHILYKQHQILRVRVSDWSMHILSLERVTQHFGR